MNASRTGRASAWREEIAAGLAGAGRDWLFVLRAAAAMLVAGWLALRFNLEEPASTMITVGIVMHPHSGMVMAKSFYRALGTLAGSLVGLVLVALFPQQRVLFLLAMSLWIGLCAGGSALHRNFKSYGFVLAGYTAAIVAIPVLATPTAAFDAAVMRVSEVMLGLLVASVFSDVIVPQRLVDTLRRTLRTQFHDFTGFVRRSLGGALDRATLERLHLRVVRDVLEIENLRSSVVFEDAGQRLRSPRLRRLNQAFMRASTTYESLHHLMNRLQGSDRRHVRSTLNGLFADVAAAMAVAAGDGAVVERARALQEALTVLQETLRGRVAAAQRFTDRDRRLDFATGAELLQRFVDELREYAAAYVALATRAPRAHPDEATPAEAFAHQSDRVDAALVTARTTLVMLATGTFWIASAWPYGAGAMLIATIFSGLMAASPQPLAAIRNMFTGYLGGIVAAFACVFAVLIHMHGFVLLAAGLLPFLLLGFYLYTRPSLPGIGSGYVIAFVYMVGVQERQLFDGVAFINDAISQLVGIGATAVAFLVFAGVSSSRWLQARLLTRLRRQVSRACHDPLPGLAGSFESASRDLLGQIVNLTPAGSEASRHLLGWALSVQETGRALIELRGDLAAIGEAPAAPARAALAALAALYERPGAQRYAVARRAVAAAIDDAPAGHPMLTHLHLLRLALLDADSLLGACMPVPATATGDPAHAP